MATSSENPLELIDLLVEKVLAGKTVEVTDPDRKYLYSLYGPKENYWLYVRWKGKGIRRFIHPDWRVLNRGWHLADYMVGGDIEAQARIVLALIFSGQRQSGWRLNDLKCGLMFNDAERRYGVKHI